MDGSTGAAGQISRAMMSLAPDTYSLSFALIGSQRGLTTSTTVTLGSLCNQTFILGSSDVTDGIVNDTIGCGTDHHGANFHQRYAGQYRGASGQRQFLGSVCGNSSEPATLSLLGLAWRVDGTASTRYFQVTPSSSTGITPGWIRPAS